MHGVTIWPNNICHILPYKDYSTVKEPAASIFRATWNSVLFVRYKVLTAVLMIKQAFWDMRPCQQCPMSGDSNILLV